MEAKKKEEEEVEQPEEEKEAEEEAEQLGQIEENLKDSVLGRAKPLVLY